MQVGLTLVAFMTKGPLIFVATSTGMGEPVHALQVGQDKVGRTSLFVLVYCVLLLSNFVHI